MIAEIQNRFDYVSVVKANGSDIKYLTNAPFPIKRIQEFLLAEPETLAWLQCAPEGTLLWDIGANMGVYTFYSAVACKLQVVSFEPESSNFALINKNITLNNMHEKVIAYPFGLSDKTGPSILYRYHDFESAAINSLDQEVDVFLQPMKAKYKQGVVSYAADDLVFAHDFKKPQLVKIDVDGLEHLILKGMQKTLDSVSTVLVELNFRIKEHQEIIEMLLKKGFHFHEKLNAMITIEDGVLTGMCNVIFHRDRGVLETIYQKTKAIRESERYQKYIQSAEAGVAYKDPELIFNIEKMEHR